MTIRIQKTLKSHIRDTFNLAWPVMVGQVGHVMMAFIDNAMVGRVSPEHLAAASIANGIFFIVMVVGLGMTYAIAPLVAIAAGARDDEQCGRIFHDGFYINLATAIVLSAITFFGSEIIRYLGQTGEVTELAIPYAKIIAVSTIPMMMFQSYRQFTEGFGITRPAMFISVFANIIHAGMNYTLIYGKLGFPAMELNGAGWATLASRTLMAAAMIWFVLSNSRFKKYNLNIFPLKFDKIVSKKILIMGLGSGFQYFFEVACFVFAAVMVGWIGAKELAAHQIAINVAGITYMAVVGISAASAIRTGNFSGAGNYRDTRLAGFTAVGLGVSFMLISGIILISFQTVIPTLYVHDHYVEKTAASLLVIAAMFQIFDGTQAVGLGILRGIADSTIPTAITFIAYWVIAIPLAYYLGFVMKWGAQGIWIGLLIGLMASAGMLTTRFWIKCRKLERDAALTGQVI